MIARATPLALFALVLAAAAAFAQTGPAKELEEMRSSMDRWVLMARPDAADPDVRLLADQLKDLRVRARTAKPEDRKGVASLQADFDDWRQRFERLCYNRRPETAPQDEPQYDAQLQKLVQGLSAVHVRVKGAEKRLASLKGLVDPLAFEFAVEGSRDRGGVGGRPSWLAPQAAAAPKAAAAPAWTPDATGHPGFHSDLAATPPPAADPQSESTLSGIAARAGHRAKESCYAAVKWIFAKMGIVDYPQFWGRGKSYDNVDFQGRRIKDEEVRFAADFGEWATRHPSLQSRPIKRVHSPTWPLQAGQIVVWHQGSCGYSATAGHIEWIYWVAPDGSSARAVSDFAGAFKVGCFQRLAPIANQVEPAIAQLEAQRDAAHERLVQAKQSGDGPVAGRESALVDALDDRIAAAVKKLPVSVWYAEPPQAAPPAAAAR